MGTPEPSSSRIRFGSSPRTTASIGSFLERGGAMSLPASPKANYDGHEIGGLRGAFPKLGAPQNKWFIREEPNEIK